MSNINLPSQGSSAAGPVRGTAPLTPTQAAQAITSTSATRGASPLPGRSEVVGAPVHMAAEEMEKHIDQALESSPALTDDQAPLIELGHLDAPPEDDEIEVPEGEGEADDFEAISLDGNPEAEEEDKTGDKEEGEGGGGTGTTENYLASELRRYQQDRDNPAKRSQHLLRNHQGEDRPREALTAVACETILGGLARPLAGSGAFIGLAGAYQGKQFGQLGLANPAQLQPFIQALRKAISRPDLDHLLLDFEKLPAQHQSYILKTLPATGAKPQQLLIWLGGDKLQWS